MIETVFHVPKLNQASVANGGCCPVPAEAVLLPELELIPGVEQADADWQTSKITVRHTPEVDPAELASLLDELSYPAQSWHTRELPATGDERGRSPLRRAAPFQNSQKATPVVAQEKSEYQRPSVGL
jgi:deferrochelatase/peroxidase EfeB